MGLLNLGATTVSVIPKEESASGVDSAPSSALPLSSCNNDKPVFRLSKYAQTFGYNVVAFLLPSLYTVLSLLWTSRINAQLIATTTVYTYIGDIVDAFNNGLPRAAFHVIGNAQDYSPHERARQACSLIFVQAIIGLLLTIGSIAGARGLVQAFVPRDAWNASLEYVQLSAVHAFTSALETAVATSTRSLDLPQIPAGISIFKVVLNIALDLANVSPFHVGNFTPTVNTQAAIRLGCDMLSALGGLAAFLYLLLKRDAPQGWQLARPSWSALTPFLGPAAYFFAETAIRMAPFLWLSSSLVQTSMQLATAWSIFSVLTWALFLVPVQAAEASSAVYISHLWAAWRHQMPSLRQSNLAYGHVREFLRPAMTSFVIVGASQLVLYIGMSTRGAEAFAQWISHDDTDVSHLVSLMWQTIGWSWILYSLYTTIAAVFLAASPRLYFIQSAVAVILGAYPCAIAGQVLKTKIQLSWLEFGIWFAICFAMPFASAACALPLWLRTLHKKPPSPVSGG